MFVAVVDFEIDAAATAQFMPAMRRQAENSVALEAGCTQFDICVDPDDPTRVLLYEVYVDEAAFEVHLRSSHFVEFDRLTRPWVRSRTITRWERCDTPA